MFRILGELVTRRPVLTIALWGFVIAATAINTPRWEDVWQNGEFRFLPEESGSRRAERLFRQAFPSSSSAKQGEQLNGVEGGVTEEDVTIRTPVQQDPLGSNVVIVAEREDRQAGLLERDRTFIEQVLRPRLEEIRLKTPPGYEFIPLSKAQEVPVSEQVIKGVVTQSDPKVGALLVSPNQRSTLVIVELSTEFLDRQNGLVIGRVEELLSSPEVLNALPAGLSLALSGSATVGRDMLRAEALSASRTDMATKIFVVFLLLILYRAPLLAFVPLATVGIAVHLTLCLLRHMAKWEWIGLFTGLEVYVTVVVYGAGIDYCLFLIARYKEELDRGRTYQEAMSISIQRVGVALATSAWTSIVGIGMMGFAEFGKFRQAGFAIAFGLFVVLCFAVTFTPAALVLLQKWAFWPDVRSEQLKTRGGWLPSTRFWPQFDEQQLLDRAWGAVARTVLKRPALVFCGTIAAMLPFAIVGILNHDKLSYGLLTDLPAEEPSVRGARVVQKHFAAGVTGPTTMLLEFDRQDLHALYGGEDLRDVTTARRLSEQITQVLEQQTQNLGIDDIRNQFYPLGSKAPAREYIESLSAREQTAIRKVFVRKAIGSSAHRTYTGLQGDLAGTVMRMDLVFNNDPFARNSITQLSATEQAIRESLPKELQAKAQILSLGPTSGIRDLKFSTDRDQITIDVLVAVSVYILLVIMLRQPAICAYLIASVVFSYLVALGVTYLVFYLRDPAGFVGIDWKVPIYLFTILIAMGEDYNILLMARIQEEQEIHGPVQGIMQALIKTGGIISSCGIIMAGTFLTLMAGTLLGMVQLGFALAFGVFLDTFVIRPILVPAYLVLLNTGRMGPFGRILGAKLATPAAPSTTLEPPAD